METLIESLAVVLPGIAVFCVLFILLLNAYLKVRRLIPVKVNCWFCNHWTKVHYDLRNCFECPACLQYNGFNADGDYNKPIPSQYEELLNHDVIYNQPNTKNSPTSSNGLCNSCNNNLRLKTFQLANYIPLNENNYDAEIEHFEHQLNKSYSLCMKCESVVKKTLRKQNELLGLKLPNLRKRGIRLLDFNGYSRNKRSFWIKVIGCMLVTIALCNIIYILSRFDYSNDNLKEIAPEKLYPYFIKIAELCKMIHNSVINLFNRILPNNQFFVDLKENHEYNAKFLCILGALLQFVLIFLSDDGPVKKVIQTVGWALLVWLSWNYPIVNVNYNNYLQILVNILIIASICITLSSNIKHRKLKRKPSLYKSKRSKNVNGYDEKVYEAHPVKKRNVKSHQPTPHTEFVKPYFDSPTNYIRDLPSKGYNSSSYMYNVSGVPEKHLNVPDDLVTDLTKLHLGQYQNLKTYDSFENPFFKVCIPSYNRNPDNCTWDSKTYLQKQKSLYLPTTPSSFTLKVQFSTRNAKT